MKAFHKKKLLFVVSFSLIMVLVNYIILKEKLELVNLDEIGKTDLAQFLVFVVFGGPIDPNAISISSLIIYTIFPFFMLINIFSFLTDEIGKVSLLYLVRKRSAARFVLHVEKKLAFQVVAIIVIYFGIQTLFLSTYVSFLYLLPFLIVTLLIYILLYFCWGNLLYLFSMMFSKIYTTLIYMITLLLELFLFYLLTISMAEDVIHTKYSFIFKFFLHTKSFINFYDMPFSNWQTITIVGNYFIFNIIYLIILSILFACATMFLIRTKRALIFNYNE